VLTSDSSLTYLFHCCTSCGRRSWLLVTHDCTRAFTITTRYTTVDATTGIASTSTTVEEVDVVFKSRATNIWISEVQWYHGSVAVSNDNQSCRLYAVVPHQIQRHRPHRDVTSVSGHVESESYSHWKRVEGILIGDQYRLDSQHQIIVSLFNVCTLFRIDVGEVQYNKAQWALK